MTPADLELVIEALSMAASRKESMARSTPYGADHERRAIAMRSLRRRLTDRKPRLETSTGLTAIERTLVGWFEANDCHLEHDGQEWFASFGGRMIPLTELAVAISLALEPV
jgi:hypothetical protein